MKCQNCGAELNVGETFCQNCGNKVISDELTNVNQSITTNNSFNNNQNNTNISQNITNNSDNNYYTNNLNTEPTNTIPNNTNSKKKKNYWWIPIVLFLGFPLTRIITLVIGMYIDSNELEYGLSNKALYTNLTNLMSIINLLGILSCLLWLPSIGLVVFLNNKNQAQEK